jgi:hypothetical protein
MQPHSETQGCEAVEIFFSGPNPGPEVTMTTKPDPNSGVDPQAFKMAYYKVTVLIQFAHRLKIELHDVYKTKNISIIFKISLNVPVRGFRLEKILIS